MNFNYEQINLYIHGELKGEELAHFEAQLQADKAFVGVVDFYRDMDRMLFAQYRYEQEYADLVELFNELQQKYFPNNEFL